MNHSLWAKTLRGQSRRGEAPQVTIPRKGIPQDVYCGHIVDQSKETETKSQQAQLSPPRWLTAVWIVVSVYVQIDILYIQHIQGT